MIIVFFVLALIQQIFLAGTIQDISYGTFQKYLTEGKIQHVNITPQLIRGVLSSGQSFVTIRVDDPKLVEQLDAQGIDYSGKHENKLMGAILSWVVPLAIFFLIWQWAFKRMGPGGAIMSFGKNKTVAPNIRCILIVICLSFLLCFLV